MLPYMKVLVLRTHRNLQRPVPVKIIYTYRRIHHIGRSNRPACLIRRARPCLKCLTRSTNIAHRVSYTYIVVIVLFTNQTAVNIPPVSVNHPDQPVRTTILVRAVYVVSHKKTVSTRGPRQLDIVISAYVTKTARRIRCPQIYPLNPTPAVSVLQLNLKRYPTTRAHYNVTVSLSITTTRKVPVRTHAVFYNNSAQTAKCSRNSLNSTTARITYSVNYLKTVSY